MAQRRGNCRHSVTAVRLDKEKLANQEDRRTEDHFVAARHAAKLVETRCLENIQVYGWERAVPLPRCLFATRRGFRRPRQDHASRSTAAWPLRSAIRQLLKLRPIS